MLTRKKVRKMMIERKVRRMCKEMLAKEVIFIVSH
jgi:hypothetical protein